MVYACPTHHQTGDTDSFQLVISLTIQLNRQGTFVPCEARIVWYSAGRTSSRQLRDTTKNRNPVNSRLYERSTCSMKLCVPLFTPPEYSDNQAEAETCFHHAIVIAQNQQAKSFELRTATSLACLWQQQGKRIEACELLAPVYGWFTEGLDTVDLQEAKALLDALA